ncbi:MAG: AAA family ATPase [Nanoarchaeota archaeon]|nr:AAA family ATPase [Nanoarchaeota archaeon]
MNLKKIILHNIRSYKDEEIEFPQGSLLLSGEAGSGKSTILLGIEFALFGLAKGKEGISSDALLRRGEDECFVNLFFSIDGKDVEIKRILKKKQDKIQQQTGQIKIDGKQEELSPDELRTRVLQLFNYPLEFIKKGKGLPFHYTVYTQQEQMKSILLEGADLRINTLRRVFGVDKYKTIKENSDIFASVLREKIKEKEGAILDLPEKQEQLVNYNKEKEKHEFFLEELSPDLEKAKKELEKRKQEIQELEKKLDEYRKIKENLSIKKNEKSNFKERLEKEEREFDILKNEIKELADVSVEFNEKEFAEIETRLKELSDNLNKKEEEIRQLIQTLSKIEVKKENALSLKDKITKVDICPECGQKVTEEHKHEINERADKDVRETNEKMLEINNLKKEKQDEKTRLERMKQEMQRREKQVMELKVKADSLKEKFKRKEKIDIEKKELMLKIQKIDSEIVELVNMHGKYEGIEQEYSKNKEFFEVAREKEKEFEIKKAGITKILENIDSQIKLIGEEIQKKEKFKEDMLYLKDLREWISEKFSTILSKIEQSVLATLHSQFDTLMKKWFSMLVEEPEITVRLDTEFSPIVEQAGYDTDYSHLSGGERTAVALAYRLALNQVINSLISQIKTRNLLILDEPTEGFSYSQLDKMRNVLQELNLKQLIIISHNPKIESFVDNIIRIRKEGHVSKIV